MRHTAPADQYSAAETHQSGRLSQRDILNNATSAVFNHFFGARLTGQPRIVSKLHALLTIIINIGKPNQLGRNFTGGIKAFVLLTTSTPGMARAKNFLSFSAGQLLARTINDLLR